jgi:hypothetical protein
MKSLYLRSGLALLCAVILSACGGGNGSLQLSGTISGLVLTNGGNDLPVAAGATSFTFPQQIDYGTDYNITILKNPDHMTCGIAGGSGSAGHTISIQAAVTCVQNTYSLSGQYTGVTPAADGTARTVTLLNGSTSTPVTISSATATNGEFVFSSPVADGVAYGVTVVDPKNGLSCTLTNGTGIMHETPVSNIVLTCVSN